MTPAPRISAIVSTYNGERYLRQAIESILRQTFYDFELIIVNDGSNDGTAELLNSFSDERIRVITNERNLGIAASQNRALAAARGQYLALQDHDDLSEPERFQMELALMDAHPHVSVAGSNCNRIDAAGEVVRLWSAPLDDIDIKWEMIFRNPLCHASLMIRREAVQDSGGYSLDPAYRFAEDYEFLSRLTTTGEFKTIDAPLVRWREHTSSASIQHDANQQTACRNIALRNMRLLLGGEEILQSTWRNLQVLLKSNVADRVDITSDDVHSVTKFLRTLLDAFHRYYAFPRGLAAAHHKRMTAAWGRHWIALSYKRNGLRDLRCRSALLSEGLRLVGARMPANRTRFPPSPTPGVGRRRAV